MAHGAADYTRITQAKMVAASVELDLPLILVDRFDSANFLWNGTGTGADWDVLPEVDAAYEGDAGLALRTRLTGPLANDVVTAQRHAFITPTTKMSFSSPFRLNHDETLIQWIYWWIQGRYQDQLFTCGFRYRPLGNWWDYWNAAGGWTQLALNQDIGADTWNRIYFEIDLANWQYLTLSTNDHQETLQSTPIQHGLAVGAINLYIEIQISTTGAARADASIDNIILKELGT